MKLFNKERFKLIERKRLKNYLIYATGEIILVVVGILIAVSINGYNNNVNLSNTNEVLRKQVIIELEDDIERIKKFQEKLDRLNQEYLTVLNYSQDSINDDFGTLAIQLPFKIEVLSLTTSTMNLIDNANLDNSKAAKDMLDLSSAYKRYLKDIDDVETVIFKAMSENLKSIERNQDWYVQFITEFKYNSDCFTYFTTNKGHRARMASLRFLYDQQYGEIINGFKNDLELYLKALKTIQSN